VLWRVRNTFHSPADLWLALRIGRFIHTLPEQLDQAALPAMLAQIAAAPRPPAPDLAAGVARIARLRGLWLRRRRYRGRDTCYLRALTLFRFLDTGGRPMHIHFGVEPDPAAGRHRGHAWITVDGIAWEPPEAVVAERTRELFVYPSRERP